MNTSGTRILSFRNPVEEITGAIAERDNRSGSSVRDWRTRMMLGLDCSTAYSRSTRKVVPVSKGYWEWKWRDRPNSSYPWTERSCRAWGHPTQDNVFTFSSIPVSNDNEAKAKFVQKLGQVQRSMDLGVSLGELRQTLNQIRHPINSLRTSINDYLSTVKKRARVTLTRRRRRQDGTKSDIRRRAVIDAITGTYLEWKFGVVPTLRDIDDIADALSKMSGTVLDIKRIRGRSSWTEVIADSAISGFGDWLLTGDGMFGPVAMAQVKLRRSVVFKGQVTYSGAVGIESPVKTLSQEFGLTPDRFVPTVWNLLPWSWAFDYVLNVGNIIDALATSYGSVRWCNQAIKWEATETWSTAGLLTREFSVNSNREDRGIGVDIPSIVRIETNEYVRIPYEANAMTFTPRFLLKVPKPVKLLNLGAAIWNAHKVSQDLDKLIRSG